MRQATIERILAGYGISNGVILPMQHGYRNHVYPIRRPGGTDLNLILYKMEPGILARIRRANAVSDWLAASGLPVRVTADPRIVRLATRDGQKYGSLYEYLPGNTIPWEGYTREHLKQLGGMMGHMHRKLAHMPQAQVVVPVKIADECLALLERMQRYFMDPRVNRAMEAKLGLYVPAGYLSRQKILLQAAACLPRPQVLHMDFVRSNILYDGNGSALHISGVLDFEKTAFGSPLFDLARTLAFLLVDCKYKSEAKVRKYFLQSGYIKRGGVSLRRTWVRIGGERVDVLEGLVEFFLLHDLYKFLRHNPYESLEQNEHFVRTRALLQ